MAFAAGLEADVDARTRNKELAYVFKTAGSLQKSAARRVTISPIGELRDPGFSG
jgi:CRISPR-associated endonuclease Csn1